MRPLFLLPLLPLLATPLLAADPPASAPAATRPAKPVLQIHVVFTSGGAPGPRGGMGRYVVGLEKSTPLESHITSMEIVDTEEVPAEDAQTRRKFTYLQYYLRIHLDAAGTAEINRMIKLSQESDKRFNGENGAPLVAVNDDTQGPANLIPHPDKKTAELRIAVTEKPFLALAAAVKQNWKLNYSTSSPPYDWINGKLPPNPNP